LDPATGALPSTGQGAFDGLLPMLAASEEERET
jgi:hypothetical protein